MKASSTSNPAFPTTTVGKQDQSSIAIEIFEKPAVLGLSEQRYEVYWSELDELQRPRRASRRRYHYPPPTL
jgi:hypothetical protein